MFQYSTFVSNMNTRIFVSDSEYVQLIMLPYSTLSIVVLPTIKDNRAINDFEYCVTHIPDQQQTF